MSPRAHLVLRLLALAVLVGCALIPARPRRSIPTRSAELALAAQPAHPAPPR